MQHSYGSCPADDAAAAAPRDVARGVRGFVVVAAAAAVLGVLCVQGLLSAGAERATLMDKQQAAWWGAPHKDRNGLGCSCRSCAARVNMSACGASA